MAEDIAFKIQLGLVLPKLEEQLTVSVTSIIEDMMDILKKGTLSEEDAPTLDDVKSLFLQDFEIFLDNTVLAAIAEKNKPEMEEVAEEASSEDEAAEPESA